MKFIHKTHRLPITTQQKHCGACVGRQGARIGDIECTPVRSEVCRGMVPRTKRIFRMTCIIRVLFFIFGSIRIPRQGGRSWSPPENENETDDHDSFRTIVRGQLLRVYVSKQILIQAQKEVQCVKGLPLSGAPAGWFPAECVQLTERAAM